MEFIALVLSIFIILLLLIGALVFYFLPTYVAYKRNQSYKGVIFLINLFLGWTFLGWVGCLVFAFIEGEKVVNVFNPTSKYDNLAKLQDLKANGALTEEEYEREKNKILK